jgi:hypothetical protein
MAMNGCRAARSVFQDRLSMDSGDYVVTWLDGGSRMPQSRLKKALADVRSGAHKILKDS